MILAALFLAVSLTPAQQERAEAIYAEIRCVVCKNQSIGDSEAELAQIMRAIVDQRIAAGDSDAEVRGYLTDRYGDAVLLRPRASGGNLALWAGPIIALAVGSIGVFSLFRGGAKAEE